MSLHGSSFKSRISIPYCLDMSPIGSQGSIWGLVSLVKVPKAEVPDGHKPLSRSSIFVRSFQFVGHHNRGIEFLVKLVFSEGTLLYIAVDLLCL